MASLRTPAIMAAFFAFQAFSMAAELRLKQTPHGTHYGIVADHPGGPAPTLFIIGNPISMMNQANMRYLHVTGEVLAKHGWIYVMLDPACEGFNAKGGEPSGLYDWAAHAKK
jgi:hypothetical protein